MNPPTSQPLKSVPLGFGATLFAYAMGSYQFGLVAYGISHWWVWCAPLTLPFAVLIGVSLIGNRTLPTDAASILFGVGLWLLSVVAWYGLLWTMRDRRLLLWPFILSITTLLATYFWANVESGAFLVSLIGSAIASLAAWWHHRQTCEHHEALK